MKAAVAGSAELAPLEILARAVAGRPVELRASRRATHSDGRAVFLGPETTTMTGQEQRWAVIAQASLIAAGSLEPQVARRLAALAGDRRASFVSLELQRGLDMLRDVLPSRYRSELAALCPPGAPRSTSADASVDLALSDLHLPAPPSWAGVLHPRGILRTRAADRLGTAISAAEIAAGLRAPEEDDEDDTQDHHDAERSSLLEKLAGPFSGPLGTAFQRMLGARRSEGDGVAGSGVTRARSMAGRPHRVGTPIAAPGSPLTLRAAGDSTGLRYPEWDEGRRAYREDWCTVSVVDPARTSAPPPPAHDTAARALARQLARVSPAWTSVPRCEAGADLDLTAVVEHRVATVTRSATDPRLFQGQRRSAGELAVVVLLDATESVTASRTGHHGESSLFQANRALADTLNLALHSLDVRWACHAFRSRGRHDVRVLRGKTFEDRWDASARGRLHGIEAGGFTRLGAVIRHGTALLHSEVAARRKVLIVVGDGTPYDDGYEGRYALADSRRAVHDAREAGITCLGLTARPAPDLASLWGPSGHCVVPEPGSLARDLPAALMAAFATSKAVPPPRLRSLA